MTGVHRLILTVREYLEGPWTPSFCYKRIVFSRGGAEAAALWCPEISSRVSRARRGVVAAA
jgi:hypothetical protein